MVPKPRPLAILATLAVVTISFAPLTFAADRLAGYAPPGVFGPWREIRASIGSATYTISYKTLGKTAVDAEVAYVDETGKARVKPFVHSVRFTTGNCVSAPCVRFRGIPFGSALEVTVGP
jgi:hypothetical protein